MAGERWWGLLVSVISDSVCHIVDPSLSCSVNLCCLSKSSSVGRSVISAVVDGRDCETNDGGATESNAIAHNSLTPAASEVGWPGLPGSAAGDSLVKRGRDGETMTGALLSEIENLRVWSTQSSRQQRTSCNVNKYSANAVSPWILSLFGFSFSASLGLCDWYFLVCA